MGHAGHPIGGPPRQNMGPVGPPKGSVAASLVVTKTSLAAALPLVTKASGASAQRVPPPPPPPPKKPSEVRMIVGR